MKTIKKVYSWFFDQKGLSKTITKQVGEEIVSVAALIDFKGQLSYHVA